MNTDFKKEWSELDFATVKKQITKLLKNRHFETHHSPNADPFCIAGYSWEKINDILGLAYTYTSSWACYTVFNTSLYLDAGHLFSIEFFTINKAGFVFAVCWDKDENEIIVPI